MKKLFEKICTKRSFLNILYVIFLISICRSFFKAIFTERGLSENCSEFLINYQGGFVRRGLFGELFFTLRSVFPFDVEWTLKIFCAVCLIAVCTFFIYQFIKRKYSLYILPLCFFLGAIVIYNDYWIRKDTLMILFLITSLWIFQLTKISFIVKIFIINILLIFMTLSHEVFSFFSIPIFTVLIINYFKERGFLKSLLFSFLSLTPTLIAFLSVIYARGNLQIAQTIWDSWLILLNKELTPLDFNNSIGALSWETIPTLKGHFAATFFTVDWNILSLFVWIITLPVIYYITTNYLSFFSNSNSTCNEEKKTVLSAILIFQFICLLPLFLGISKDYIRLIFYLTTSSFAIFFLIPFDTLKQLFPKFYISFIDKINRKFNNFISPSKAVLVLLMLLIGISNYGFSIKDTVISSMLYQVLKVMSQAVNLIIELFMT